MKTTGAAILIKKLEEKGITSIAGIPGGNILPIYNALHGSKIQHILARHEQGAAFIAQGMARASGKPSICMATSGPGATNLLTALADAYSDSIPIIAITGQVATQFRGKSAFQEIDICSMAQSAVKKTFYIEDAEQIIPTIDAAFKLAIQGRPGPILIDIPKDIQNQEINLLKSPNNKQPIPPASKIPSGAIDTTIQMIEKAQRPIIIAGNGTIISESSHLIRTISQKQNIPVANTLLGLGSFPASDDLFLGMPGMHAPRSTNMLLHRSDLIIALGIRFDDRLTGKLSDFCPDAKTIHIDINPKEIGKIRNADHSIVADLKEALEQLIPKLPPKKRTGWLKEILTTRRTHGLEFEGESTHFMPPPFIKAVKALAPADSIITTDVGQHQMWVAQHYGFERPRTLLTSGGQGTMGFGLPAAIGAATAFPDKKIIAFTGDGSLLMNIQELATLADLNLNILVLVMNNQQLGLVRQQQELFYNQNYMGSKFKTLTDFAAIAKGFGINGASLKNETTAMPTLEKAIKHKGPTLLDIPVCGKQNVLPMVAPGKANIEMIY